MFNVCEDRRTAINAKKIWFAFSDVQIKTTCPRLSKSGHVSLVLIIQFDYSEKAMWPWIDLTAGGEPDAVKWKWCWAFSAKSHRKWHVFWIYRLIFFFIKKDWKKKLWSLFLMIFFSHTIIFIHTLSIILFFPVLPILSFDQWIKELYKYIFCPTNPSGLTK